MYDTFHQVIPFLTQLVVVCHKEDAVTGSDSEEGDEPDDGRNADDA